MAKYSVELYDSNGDILVHLYEAQDIIQNSFKLNQANTVTFALPAFIDGKPNPNAGLLQMVRQFKIYRDDQMLHSGKILKRDTSDPFIIKIEGKTHEDELNRMISPRDWTAHNGMDLADVVRYFLKDWEYIVRNTADDFQGAEITYNYRADVDIDPGAVTIAKKPVEYYTHETDDGDVQIPYRQYHTVAEIEFTIDIPEGITEVEYIRFAQEVGTGEGGKSTYVSFKYQHSTDGGTTWSDWSNEIGKNSPPDQSDKEGFYIGITGLQGNQNKIRVKWYLTTNDTEILAHDWDDLVDTSVTPPVATGENVRGITPVLRGFVLICRKPGYVTEGNIPFATGIVVRNSEVNQDKHLSIIIQLCKEHGYEFKVNDDYTLDLAEQFGIVHEQPFICGPSPSGCDEGINCQIEQLTDDFYPVRNTIYCFGQGEGSDQLFTVVRDTDSIAQYEGEYPDILTDTSIDNIADLQAAGAEKLQPQPLQRFRLKIPVGEDMPFVGLGDTITIIMLREQIETTGGVVEWSVGAVDDEGEVIYISLDTPEQNFITRLVERNQRSIKTNFPISYVPSNVRVTGGYAQLRVTWSGNADYYLLQYTQTPDVADSWQNIGGQIPTKDYVIAQLPINTKYYIRVAGVKGSIMSQWSDAYGAKTTSVPVSDLDTTPPNAPVLNPIVKDVVIPAGVPILRNTLSWNLGLDNDLAGYNIYRAKKRISEIVEGDLELLAKISKSNSFVDTKEIEENTWYTYAITAYDRAENESGLSNYEEVLTDQKPDAPGGVLTIDVQGRVNAVRVSVSHTGITGLVDGYEVYANVGSPAVVDNSLVATAELKGRGYNLTFEFPAEVGQDIYVAVRAYNRLINGDWVLGGPVQARLNSRSDMDEQIWQVKVESSNPIIEGDIYNIFRDISTHIIVGIDNDLVMTFEYPVYHLMDSVESKVLNYNDTLFVEPISIEYYDESTSSWVALTYTTVDLGNSLKRYLFDSMKRIRKFRVNYGIPGTPVNFYYLRPRVRGIFDLLDVDIVNAGYINVLSGDPNGNHQIITNEGIEGYVVGSDSVLRLASLRLNSGTEYFYNPDVSGGTTYKGAPVGKLVWTKDANGQLKDANGYVVIDVNGNASNKLILSGFIDDTNSTDIVNIGNYTVPAGYKLICKISPIDGINIPSPLQEYKYHFSSFLSFYGVFEDDYNMYSSNIGEGSYANLRVQIRHYILMWFKLMDDTNEQKIQIFDVYYEILLIKI